MKRVLVVGDTIIDRSHWLKPVGFSLETPTVKCERIKTSDEFGGAANVAKHLANSNCEVTFATSISKELVDDLSRNTGSRIVALSNRDQVKERFYLVKEVSYKYLQVNDVAQADCENLAIDVNSYDMIVVSDYRLGAASLSIISKLPLHKTICQMQISDSKADVKKYRNFHAFVGNSSEVPPDNISGFCRAMNNFLVVCTRGSESVLFSSGESVQSVEVDRLPPQSESHGAGDVFLAGFCSRYNFEADSVANAITGGCQDARKYLTRHS